MFLGQKGDGADGALLVHTASRQNPAITHFLANRPQGLPTIVYGPQGTRGWMIEGDAATCMQSVPHDKLL